MTAEEYYDELVEEGYSHAEAVKIVAEAEDNRINLSK